MKRLNKVFSDWISNGIFATLQNYNVPWKNENISNVLDINYFTNRSGDKFISPLIVKMMSGDTLTQTEQDLIARTIFAVHGKNWAALWDTLSFEYNPIENYRMIENMTNDTTVDLYGRSVTRTDNLSHGKTGSETETPNITDTRTDNLTHTKKGDDTQTLDLTDARTDNLTHTKKGDDTQTLDLTDARTDNLTHKKTGSDTVNPNTTEITTPALHNEQTNSVAGFNSSGFVSSDKQNTSATGTNTVKRTGDEETVYNTTETNTGTQIIKKTGTETTEYDITETDTGTQTTKKTGTDTTEYDTTETDTGTQVNAKTGTDTIQYNLTETDTGTQVNAESGQNSHTRNYQLTRSGNIGVTTSQQMIQSERDLWKWNFFNDVVFPDIDAMLTLMVY